ncbi:MAG TPA: LacI family DNA-binding transcriptional regulator [Streptosporangiaceae bacterium]|nr:LacI family DNA-binding transcriptional regulator [Streptosporangiaceae bacterium]
MTTAESLAAPEVVVPVALTGVGAPPTLADVARLAGVSPATASRVLTGSVRVRQQTVDKVQDAMTALGYVRNRAPRSSTHRLAGAIALVFCEEAVKALADPFFERMVRSLSKALASADLQLILLTLHSPREYYTVSRYLRAGHVDGALLVSMHSRPDFDFAGLGIPLVLCGRPVKGGENLSYIDADNVDGARNAVNYLLNSGRKAIATIAGPSDMAPGIDRLLGYRKAMIAAGINDPGMIAYGDFGLLSGEHAMYRLIDHRPSLDAVFVASDLMAAGALRALRRLGRRVPDDVAVIGFDDSPLSLQTKPRLSTVRQPVDAMAAQMASELLSIIAGPRGEPVHLVLDTELILRDSA